jgi:hypothetical protein
MPVLTRSMVLKSQPTFNPTIYRGFFIVNDNYINLVNKFYEITTLKPGEKLFPDITMKQDININEIYNLLYKNYYDTNMWNIYLSNPSDTLVKTWHDLITSYAVVILRKTITSIRRKDKITKAKIFIHQLIPFYINYHLLFINNPLLINILKLTLKCGIKYGNLGVAQVLQLFLKYFPELACAECSPLININTRIYNYSNSIYNINT